MNTIPRTIGIQNAALSAFLKPRKAIRTAKTIRMLSAR